MASVQRAECVIDVDVSITRQDLGERLITRLLLDVEQVLKHEHFTRLQGLDRLHHVRVHAVTTGHPQGTQQQFGQPLRRRSQTELGLPPGADDPTEVAHQHQAAPSIEHRLRRRQRHADAAIVQNRSIAVHRDVEIDSNENTTTLDFDLIDGLLGHRCIVP